MRTCTIDGCDKPSLERKGGRGRHPMHCAEHKAQRLYNQQFSPTKTCTEDACGKPVKAHDLCNTHYGRTLASRHKSKAYTCDCCGETFIGQSRTQRYAHTFCSALCRDYFRFGPTSSDLPQDHWARTYGLTCEWVPPRQPTTYDCAWCGTSATTTQPIAKYCTRACKVKHSKVRRRGAEHGAIGTYTWSEIVKLWATFDRQCAYCHTPTPLDAIQAEHVHPLSRGGANNLTNLLPACAPCNSDKRDLLLNEWNADRLRRGLNKVTTSWEHDDQRYSHLTTNDSRVMAVA